MTATRAYQWTAPGVGDAATADRTARQPVRLGFVGLGLMGTMTLQSVLTRRDIEIAALCDVDKRRLDAACDLLKTERPTSTPKTFSDFHDLHRCEDVEAVIISTPDHWHALQGIDAMRCGKDVYIEKPLTLTIAEGRALCDAVTETGRVCQTGSQQRSSREFRYACELIRNGYLGRINRVEFTIPENNRHSTTMPAPSPVPPELNYDAWLGPAPERPYYEDGCHYNFRFIKDFSGGQITNWGAHMLDIAHWALNQDGGGPLRVSGTGTVPPEGLFDTPDHVDIVWTYPDDVKIHCVTSSQDPILRFTGSTGALTVGRGSFEAMPSRLEHIEFASDAERLTVSDDHMTNFLDSLQSRQHPICSAEVGHRTATACHLAGIAIQLGRELEWDPAEECFANDDDANGLRSRPSRLA